jgi:hypothetical protein
MSDEYGEGYGLSLSFVALIPHNSSLITFEPICRLRKAPDTKIRNTHHS